MDKHTAYQIVYADLHKIAMFRGNMPGASRSFLNGIWVVMNMISLGAGHELEFLEEFEKNMRGSVEDYEQTDGN